MSSKIDKPYNPGLPEPTERGMKLLPNAVVTSKNGQYYCCCCNHKGEKIYIPVPRSWGSLTGDIHDQKDLIELLLSITLSPADKEVFTVLTADTTDPSSPTESDLYINTSTNKLYKYTSGAWAEDSDDTMTEAVYVAEDTGHVWTYNGSAFVDSGSNVVDGVIYVRNLTTDLEPYTTEGVYTVAYKPNVPRNSGTTWYNLSVKRSATARRNVYNYQTLSNQQEYKKRYRKDVLGNVGTWTDWDVKYFAYKEPKVALSTVLSSGTYSLRPSTLYYSDTELTADFTIAFLTQEYGTAHEYHIMLKVSATASAPLTMSFPSGVTVKWNGGSAPALTEGYTYEISIMPDLASNTYIGAFFEIEPPAAS